VSRASKYQDPGAIYNFARSQDARRGLSLIRQGGFFESSVFSDYPYRIDPFRMFTVSGSLTQPVFTAGRVLNQYKYARLGVDYAALQVEVERQDLILEAYEAYYGIMRGQKLLEVDNQSVMALEALRNRAQAFYDAKQLPKLDVLATQGQLSEARKRVTQAQTQIDDSREQLNYLMRLPLDTRIDIIQDYEFRPAPYTVPQIFMLAAANRLELRQASISATQAVALAEAAKGALWPAVYLEVRGTRMNDDWNVFDQEGINEWTITGALQWNFDAFRNRETLQERRAAAARAWTEQEQLVDTVFRDVSRAYRRMKRTESDIQQNRAAVEARREAFRVAKERYNALLSTYTEVLDAERQLHQSLGDYYESLIDYRLDQATLERQMGILRN
jgi:outer membrane protein